MPELGPENAAVLLLAKRVHDLKNTVLTLAKNLENFQTADQVVAAIDAHQKTADRRLRNRTIIGVLIAVLIGGGVGGGSAWAVRTESHNRAVRACHDRALTNQAIRDIVDRSQTRQIDQSKLSPVAREILAEFARAEQAGAQKSLHDFVYARTPIFNCSKI